MCMCVCVFINKIGESNACRKILIVKNIPKEKERKRERCEGGSVDRSQYLCKVVFHVENHDFDVTNK